MIGIKILKKNRNRLKLLIKLYLGKGTDQLAKIIKKCLIKAQLRR